jgi:hypothetical protein
MCYFQGMGEIGVAGFTHLRLMLFRSESKGALKRG